MKSRHDTPSVYRGVDLEREARSASHDTDPFRTRGRRCNESSGHFWRACALRSRSVEPEQADRFHVLQMGVCFEGAAQPSGVTRGPRVGDMGPDCLPEHACRLLAGPDDSRARQAGDRKKERPEREGHETRERQDNL